MAFETAPPLALYIHIPWCERKCPYCDFNSHEGFDASLESRYVTALLNDLDTQLEWSHDRKLVSVFIGGGTPSLFSDQAIGALLEGVDRRLPLGDDVEVTMESNPGSAEAERYIGYRRAGVNRLSIGVQSFQQTHLDKLGRIHSGEGALRAIGLAQAAGFARYNIDLMHGLPGQSVEQAAEDLQTAIANEGGHLSWYQLTIEPNTRFFNNPPRLPVEDALADIQEAGEALLTAAGFEQYEVSAYSKPGEQSLHNLNYWQFGDYLAIGAGAHGKITRAKSGTDMGNGSTEVFRFQRTRVPRDYMQRIAEAPTPDLQPLDEALLAGEFMLNALRLQGGVPRQLFHQRTGLDWKWVATPYERCVARGLLESDESRIQCTDLGYRFLNDVVGEFLPQ